jgi:signal peptidase I
VTFLAAIASLLFPGSGQALTGRWRPAVIWGATLLVPGVGSMLIWMPLVHLVWPIQIACAIDAAVRVRRAKPGSRHLANGGIMIGALVVAAVVVRGYVIEAFTSPASSMTPTLAIGDHFLVNKLASAERGDVVVFWHPTGTQYVKRLIAMGGDVVAIREDVLYVNGTAAPRRDLGPTTYRDRDEAEDSWSIVKARAFEETYGGRRYRVLQSPDSRLGSGNRFHDFPRTDDAYFTAERDPCASHGLFDEVEAGKRRPQMKLSADGKGCVVPPGTAFLLGDNRDNSNDSRSWGVVWSDDIIGVVAGIWLPLSRAGNL